MTDSNSLRQTIVADSIKNLSANLFSLPISFVSTLLIARTLGPELTGITTAAIALVLTYTINAHMGTLNALGQRYPYLIGQGTTEARTEAEQILGIVLGFLGIAALASCAVVFGLAIWKYHTGPSLLAIGFGFGAIISALQLLKTYYFFVIRSTNQFAYLSRFTLTFAWVPLAWFAGAQLGGVVAQWATMVATETVICVFLFRSVGRNIKWEIDFKASWRYIKVGFPIYIVGTLFGVFSSIDRLAVATFLGTTVLGFYGVASMAGSLLGIVPGMIGQIMWPRMAGKLGAAGQEWREMLPFIEKPTFLMAFLLPPVIGMAVLMLPTATEVLLPRYMPGVAAAQISIITVYFLGLMGMYAVFLGTSLRLLPYGVVTAVGIGLNVAGSYLSVHFGWGLTGIAWSKVVAYGIVAFSLFSYVGRLFGYKWRQLSLRLIILLAPMAIVYALVFWIIPWLVPNDARLLPGMLWKLSFQVGILFTLTSPLIWFSLLSSGVMGDVIGIFRRTLNFETRVR
ncbi:MAG: oligosaccharide flippase family protein [Candidatus Methanoperedenaceae archaeon]|nr:oligosaccharide flippase family protein [Candidatus Methanoperedenaceae archaeon]